MEKCTNQNRNMSIAGTSTSPLSLNQFPGCEQQGHLFRPTVSCNDSNGITNAISADPEHETQSLPFQRMLHFTRILYRFSL